MHRIKLLPVDPRLLPTNAQSTWLQRKVEEIEKDGFQYLESKLGHLIFVKEDK
jgi:hypothetical protein